MGLVSRVTPVHTAMRNGTRDEGGPFEVGNQVLVSSHRKLLRSKAMVVSVAHLGGDRSLINKHQPGRIKHALLSDPAPARPGHVGAMLFCRPQTLFFEG